MELLLLLLLLLTGMFLSPASCSSNYKYYCDWCPRHATASLAAADINASILVLITNRAVVPSETEAAGTCGYGGAMYMELPNGGHPAAATADFFRAGAGCGACYQLRCRDRRLCGDEGVRIVVTDAAKEETNRTGFVLTRKAFTAMARHGMSDQLATMDNVRVDFRRVPCEYKKNLAVRVEQGSRTTRQQLLAIRFLYQGGQTDIAAVEIAQGGSAAASSSWRSMARQSKHGVWRTARAPDGPLQLRLVVTAGSGGKWRRTSLPADWRPGGVYDTGLQITDVAVRTCSRSCRSGDDDEDELR
ncbi:hypothetical protein EJB05_40919 [Eragrostis curvula]|uniref:Expansin-like EG45 domain-containing protein n=1 Tax=Eragrostis curvula TaxID=38414 RepID=A0A5J9T9C9_9POAL|nr:hypothetical protein EJB05_40919 [Eragrostis curvula]